MNKELLILIALLSLGGCATSYHPYTALSNQGYKNFKVTDKITQLDFRVNFVTSHDEVQEMFLLRVAQIAKKDNKKYFILYRTLEDAMLNRPEISISPIDSDALMPEYSAYVKFLTKKSHHAYSVDEIFKKYAKKYL